MCNYKDLELLSSLCSTELKAAGYPPTVDLTNQELSLSWVASRPFCNFAVAKTWFKVRLDAGSYVVTASKSVAFPSNPRSGSAYLLFTGTCKLHKEVVAALGKAVFHTETETPPPGASLTLD